MHPEEQYAVSLLRAGANGYITKDAVPQQVVQAIRTLLQRSQVHQHRPSRRSWPRTSAATAGLRTSS